MIAVLESNLIGKADEHISKSMDAALGDPSWRAFASMHRS